MEKTLRLIILFKWSLDTAETTSNFHETLVCVQTIYGFLNDSDFNVIPMALPSFPYFEIKLAKFKFFIYLPKY